MAGAYYNEIEPFAAEWLRNLILLGHIADGDVDTRSISEVHPDDLRGYTQCHFFAGIGVWSLALRRAGWPDDRPVWTGSCPCQPFSVAGAAGGFDDQRHLWPHWHHLIRKRRPAKVFGEQVASADGLRWLDLVLADLEGEDYAVGAADLCAAGVGAPHIRQRLWFVADAMHAGWPEGWAGAGGGSTARGCGAGGLGDTEHPGVCRQPRSLNRAEAGAGHRQHLHDFGSAGDAGGSGPTNGVWANADWLLCRDDKWRPVEPGAFPLAHGAASRVGRLRAYGNAINAEAAATFVRAAT